ncbi:uncharacterized protein LOC113561671 [Ooceraea biroi]|uniref:uncharacterized protein LOC113561671 n=1 Tax=Ooceraea biroi TaxID=2015173 RepID=UPI000F07CB8E|nr:uncharacterized protein LOC113561671 [Ooceraea biroi]
MRGTEQARGGPTGGRGRGGGRGGAGEEGRQKVTEEKKGGHTKIATASQRGASQMTRGCAGSGAGTTPLTILLLRIFIGMEDDEGDSRLGQFEASPRNQEKKEQIFGKKTLREN